MLVSKIRCYEKQEGLFFIDDLYFFEENGIHQWDGDGHYGQFDLMLPTGLIDVDGVEIYEGDIVQFETFDAVDVVVFEPPSFKTKNHSLQGYAYKVIGNIYETPELVTRQT